MLICVSGEGIYQEWGKPAIRLHAGDVIDIPEGVKHWHGATRDSYFQHLTAHVHVGDPAAPEGTACANREKNQARLNSSEVQPSVTEGNEWLEPVNDTQYNEANK